MTRKLIPISCVVFFTLSTVMAVSAEDSWSQQRISLSIKEYLDLFFATKFRNLNPAEPIVVNFVPNSSKQDALIFIVRPVVMPDLDLTDKSNQKSEILSSFQNNVNKQANARLEFARKLLQEKSVSERWAGATVERNLAIRFVRADNDRQTVALTVNGKTVFDKDEINSESATIKARAREFWIE